jgi:hypothetical protein
MFSAVGIYDVTSVSFAVSGNGNGYLFAQLQFSTNGGGTFTNIGAAQAIAGGPGSVLTFAVPAGTTINQPTLIMRIHFTQGRSPEPDR